MRALNEEKTRELIERYTLNTKESVRLLAHAFDVTVQTVYNTLERNGIPRRSTAVSVKAAQLVEACRNGAVVARAAELLGISKSTAARALRDKNISVTKGRPQLSRPSQIPQPRQKRHLIDEPNAQQIDEAYINLSRGLFPYPALLEKEDVTREVSRLRSRQAHLAGNNEIRPRNYIGTRLCAPFFPNRYKATWKSNISAFDAWHLESELRKAIRFQLQHGDPVVPHRVLRAITLRCRTPSIFKPSVARFLYDRYCSRGDVVWDPCSGYGGRLLGAFIAGVHYIGTDVDAATIDGNRRLAAAIGATGVDLHLAPAESFDPPTVDFVFTSPPYMDRERYSHASAQSWKKYGKGLDAWIDGFLRPVIERAHRALKADKFLALNVANLKERGEVVPIVSRTIDTARESGFHHVDTLLMPLAAINRTSPTEPILLFQKA